MDQCHIMLYRQNVFDATNKEVTKPNEPNSVEEYKFFFRMTKRNGSRSVERCVFFFFNQGKISVFEELERTQN